VDLIELAGQWLAGEAWPQAVQACERLHGRLDPADPEQAEFGEALAAYLAELRGVGDAPAAEDSRRLQHRFRRLVRG